MTSGRKKGTSVPLSDDVLVKASGNQVSSEVNGEAVALNLKSGVYFSLNAVGSRIWMLTLMAPSIRVLLLFRLVPFTLVLSARPGVSVTAF